MIKNLNFLYLSIIIFALFIVSWYMPFSYKIYDSSIFIKLDVFLLFLLIQAFIVARFKLIIIGFLIGFLIDIDIESNLVGINSFLMPIVSYFLGFLKLNSSNWDLKIKIIYSMIIIFMLSIFKFLFYGWFISFFDIVSIIINSGLILIVFLSINRFYYKGKLAEK